MILSAQSTPKQINLRCCCEQKKEKFWFQFIISMRKEEIWIRKGAPDSTSNRVIIHDFFHRQLLESDLSASADVERGTKKRRCFGIIFRMFLPKEKSRCKPKIIKQFFLATRLSRLPLFVCFRASGEKIRYMQIAIMGKVRSCLMERFINVRIASVNTQYSN